MRGSAAHRHLDAPSGHRSDTTRRRYGPAAVLSILGTLAVSALTFAVTHHVGVARLDPHIQRWVPAHRSSVLTSIAWVFTTVGNEITVVVVTLLASAILYLRRRFREVIVFLVGVGGSVALIFVLKHLVARHRPPEAQMLGTIERGYSFPSGHTLDGTVLVALLIWCFLWPRAHDLSWRASLVGLEVFAALGVGASRLYFDVHWGTDVLGSWLVAVTWLAALSVAVSLFEEPVRRYLRRASRR